MRRNAGSPFQLARIAASRKASSRTQRRKLEKLARKHPAEFAAATHKIEERK